jgi:glyoxylase-like metal-dependent hydrolase (beta-lactamase superfamily II)
MRSARLILGPLETNCWVVSDDADGPTIVIDPAEDADRILAEVADRGVAAVVLTHGHFDHLGAVSALLARTGAPLLVHEDDASSISTAMGTGGAAFGFDVTAPPADRLLSGGDVIQAGDLRLSVLHTPGHTPGGICLFAEASQAETPQLFAGDTLFAGSVGRTDFPGGDARALALSIAQKLAPLPGETVVHPGHGPDTTIGRERRLNPFFPRA